MQSSIASIKDICLYRKSYRPPYQTLHQSMKSFTAVVINVCRCKLPDWGMCENHNQ